MRKARFMELIHELLYMHIDIGGGRLTPLKEQSPQELEQTAKRCRATSQEMIELYQIFDALEECGQDRRISRRRKI